MPEQNKQEFKELSTSIYRHQQERQIGIKQQTILSIFTSRFKRDFHSYFSLRYIYRANGTSFYKAKLCTAGCHLWILFLSLRFIALALSQWRWQSTFISLLQRLYLLPFVCFPPPFSLLPGKLCELNPAPSPSSVTLQLPAGETI